MKQEVKLSVELSGEGRDFKMTTVFLKTNSSLTSWYYGAATLIVVAEVAIGATGFTNHDLLKIRTDSIIVETSYDYELPVSFYVINRSSYPIGQTAYGAKFIEVDSWDIEAIKGLAPLVSTPPQQMGKDINPEADNHDESLVLTQSYIPPMRTEKEEKELSHKYEKETAQYRVDQINHLIDIAKGKTISHMHSTVHSCDKSCPGHPKNFKNEQNKAKNILEKKGVFWENIETEDPYKNQKIEALYLEYQKLQLKNENDNVDKTIEDNDFSSLVIHSLFRPQLQNKIVQNNSFSCTLL